MFTGEKRGPYCSEPRGWSLPHHHHHQEKQPPRATGDTPGQRRGVADLLPAGAKGGELEVTPGWKGNQMKEKKEESTTCEPPPGNIQGAKGGFMRGAWAGIPQVATSEVKGTGDQGASLNRAGLQATEVPAADLRAEAWSPAMTAGEDRGLRRRQGQVARGRITTLGMWVSGRGQSRCHMSGRPSPPRVRGNLRAHGTSSGGRSKWNPRGRSRAPRRGTGPPRSSESKELCGAVPSP